jgi:thioredoxin-like negative regulator of GroEL
MSDVMLAAERALSFGMADEAERLYRQAVDADPTSSMAVLGLAGARLERGDEAGALDFARQALVLEPANEAASRLVTRLDEVLHYRETEHSRHKENPR